MHRPWFWHRPSAGGSLTSMQPATTKNASIGKKSPTTIIARRLSLHQPLSGASGFASLLCSRPVRQSVVTQSSGQWLMITNRRQTA